MKLLKNRSSGLSSTRKDFVSFYGIADVYGVDWFNKCGDLSGDESKQERWMAQLRANANRHRHAVYFESEDAPALYVDMIDILLKDDKFEDALSLVKSCPLRIPYECKHSWDLIPNPKLDPFYEDERKDHPDGEELISDEAISETTMDYSN